jgi:hypothetical protein
MKPHLLVLDKENTEKAINNNLFIFAAEDMFLIGPSKKYLCKKFLRKFRNLL